MVRRITVGRPGTERRKLIQEIGQPHPNEVQLSICYYSTRPYTGSPHVQLHYMVSVQENKQLENSFVSTIDLLFVSPNPIFTGPNQDRWWAFGHRPHAGPAVDMSVYKHILSRRRRRPRSQQRALPPAPQQETKALLSCAPSAPTERAQATTESSHSRSSEALALADLTFPGAASGRSSIFVRAESLPCGIFLGQTEAKTSLRTYALLNSDLGGWCKPLCRFFLDGLCLCFQPKRQPRPTRTARTGLGGLRRWFSSIRAPAVSRRKQTCSCIISGATWAAAEPAATSEPVRPSKREEHATRTPLFWLSFGPPVGVEGLDRKCVLQVGDEGDGREGGTLRHPNTGS